MSDVDRHTPPPSALRRLLGVVMARILHFDLVLLAKLIEYCATIRRRLRTRGKREGDT